MSIHATKLQAQALAKTANRHSLPAIVPGAHILPLSLVLLAALAMLWHGSISQLSNYHGFAEQRAWLGIAHAADVLSNLGFAADAIYGLRLL